ncbi:MAG TPA: ABC transporter substrate-binding protein [Candidatus Omnitrophota bacterium]|nr:ABC transporter substrate-binding protein [Candidatus Omnitrophota bacterium]
MIKSLFCFKWVLLVCVLSFSVRAHAEDISAQQGVEAFLNTIRSMEFPVKDAAQHEKKIKQAAAYLDLQAMGEKALGTNWAVMTANQQKQFMELLWKLIESIAYPRTKSFLGDQKITYTDVKPIERGVEVLSSVHDQEAALDVPVVYHLYQEDVVWKIYDIFMDGVSMTEDLQYQFDKMIQDGSVQTLLDRMSERLEEAQKETTGA